MARPSVALCFWDRFALFLLCAGVLFALPRPIFGQVVTATLYGSVTDPSGAAVPGAVLKATNTKTGIAVTRPTDEAGNYSFPSLAPGEYTLSVEKPGFQTKTVSGITLLVTQQARVDVQLDVGQVSTQVEVSGAAPIVETSTASVGTVIGERQVIDLPLNLRRLTSLATLVPGTIAASTFGYAAYIVGGSPFSEATYVSGGGRDSSNTLLVDGMESRAYDTGGFGLAPPPDAVQEFKIQTNIYSAVFGKTAGSTMNLVTKSGTNEIHGDVYEFLRNDKLDARNFFATNQLDPVTNQEIPGTARPKYRRNQFGFTVGAPIQKNKTFVFGFYDALREVKGLSLGNFVPTDAERQGNFSSALTGATANLCASSGAAAPANLNFDSGQLFDPASESLFTCPQNPATPSAPPPTILVGNPIPGNILTNIDPVAQKVLAAFPLANRPGFPNYVNQTPRDRSDNQFGVRIDHSAGAKDRIFGRYLFAQSNITDPSAGYTSLPGFGDTIFFRGQNVTTSWTHTFGPQLLNEVQIGFQRNNPVENCDGCTTAGTLSGLGIAGLKPLGPDMEGFPFFGFANFSGVGDAGYRPISNVEMTEDYRDNLTWMHGRHTVVLGTDLQWLQNLRQDNPYSPRGQFSFDGRFSSLGGEVPDAGGVSDLADLLLGYPSFAARSLGYRNVNQVGSTFWSFYGQDDFRMSSNFSINIGLRYEYRANPIDKRDNIVSFLPLGPKFSGPGNAALLTAVDDAQNDALCTDPTHANLVSATGQCLVVSSAQRRSLGFTGRTRRTLVFPDRRDFAPRIGLTWRPTSSDKLVVRTGYGIFYDLANLNTKEFVSGNPVFAPTQLFNTAVGSPPPQANGAPITTAYVFALGQVPLLNDQYSALWLDPHYVTPRVQEWSFGIESQLARDWGLEVNYVGTAAHHLDNIHLFGNQPVPGTGDYQPRRPYPDFNSLAYFTSDANSKYNALQAKLTKRFSTGFLFLTSYTWGKTMSDQEGNEGSYGVSGNLPQDDNNLRPNYGRAVSDVRQRLAFSSVWQLPVGNGKHFLNRTGVINQVLGNWQVSGILTLQSGFPISITSSTDYSNSNSTSPRPDRICSGVGKQTVESWFDTSCFTTAALQQALTAGTPRFGNSGRNILDGPGTTNLDFSLFKNFSLGERAKLEFRFESFNIFNQAHFGFPDSSAGTGNFGAIGSAGEPRDIQFGLKVEF
jgi:hypothetical protein